MRSSVRGVLWPSASAAAALAAGVLALAPGLAQAATIAPTRLDDPSGAGSCPSNCSLRQAIEAAGAGGTVSLVQPAPSGTYKLTLGPLALKAGVTIVGAGAGATSISGGDLSQLFTVAAGARVTIEGVTLTEGLARGAGGSGGFGGAITNNGELALSAVDLSHNTAAGGVPTSGTFGGGGAAGGAIYNEGLLTVIGGALDEDAARGGSAKFGLVTTEFSGGSGIGGAIDNDGTLVLDGSSFSADVAEAGEAGTLFASDGGDGGAIWNSGSARITGAAFTGNLTSPGSGTSAEGGDGGAIDNDASLRLVQSTLSSNVAGGTGAVSGSGGAIEADGALTIAQSTLVSNTAQGSSSEGGAIDSSSSLTLTASTIAANSAVDGAGIDSDSAVEATNSTIAANTASGRGGGVRNAGSMTLANVTLAGNSATAGQGGNVDNVGSALLMHDTIIAEGTVTGGSGGENCAGTGSFVSLGYNLEDRDQCGLTGPGDLVNVANPLLGPLAANGGPTETIALLAGSPAIDAGDPAGCTDALEEPLSVDQRGVARPQGARCDIGAYELVPAPPPAPAPVIAPAAAVVLPALSGLRVSPSTFRAASSGPTIAGTAKLARSATIGYADSLAATTTFKIIRRTGGVRSAKKCVAAPRHPPKHFNPRRCTRLVTLVSFTHLDRAGANSLRFSGRVHGGKLAAGTYTLTATPAIGAHVGATASTHFTIER